MSSLRASLTDLTLVAHLNGKIDRLETYFDRKLVHIGPPSAGEIWIIPPGVSYSTFAQGTEAEYTEVKMPHAAHGLSPLAGFYDPNLLRLMKSLSAFIGRTSDIDRLESSAVVQDISDEVARISYSAPRSSARQIKLSAAARNAIVEFIRDQISAQITLEDLSQVAGESPHRFLWAFRDAFGVTPAQFVITERLKQARRLLVSTDMDITSIAMRCGFADHSHLSATFRRRMNISPAKYRRQSSSELF